MYELFVFGGGSICVFSSSFSSFSSLLLSNIFFYIFFIFIFLPFFLLALDFFFPILFMSIMRWFDFLLFDSRLLVFIVYFFFVLLLYYVLSIPPPFFRFRFRLLFLCYICFNLCPPSLFSFLKIFKT